MEKRTTISIESKTIQNLKGIKIAKRESYDEIISRLLEAYKIWSKTRQN